MRPRIRQTHPPNLLLYSRHTRQRFRWSPATSSPAHSSTMNYTALVSDPKVSLAMFSASLAASITQHRSFQSSPQSTGRYSFNRGYCPRIGVSFHFSSLPGFVETFSDFSSLVSWLLYICNSVHGDDDQQFPHGPSPRDGKVS